MRSRCLIFATAGLAILPLAGLIGHATEELAARTGPQIGGLLNATFRQRDRIDHRNLLILDGQLAIVKASITGSIIGNVLLVLGVAFAVGGWRRVEQDFNRTAAGLHSAPLVIAVGALLLPALFSFTPGGDRLPYRSGLDRRVHRAHGYLCGGPALHAQVTPEPVSFRSRTRRAQMVGRARYGDTCRSHRRSRVDERVPGRRTRADGRGTRTVRTVRRADRGADHR